MSSDNQLKILTLGESFVGKTSLILRFVDQNFTSNYVSTIGVDFKSKTINHDNQEIQLCIWDTAGQERFKHLTKQYYKGADGIILVYDITSKITLAKANDWIKDISSCLLEEEIGLIIVGNKSDLETDRQIEYKEGEKFANKHNIKFFEVSAKSDNNVNEAFHELVDEILMKQKSRRSSIISEPKIVSKKAITLDRINVQDERPSKDCKC